MSRAFTAGRRQLTSLRIAAQHIDSANFTSPAEVVRHMVCMQAQDFAAAKWSVGLRAAGTTDAAVEGAIAGREFVRSWPMRGTLHFVAPEDLGWILALTRERVIRGATARFTELGLTEDVLRRAEDLAVSLLSGGRMLSRNALQNHWLAAGLETGGLRGYSMLWYLSISGVLVFAEKLGTQHSFALLSEWVSNPRLLAGDEALAELARRYFVSHGPATVRDFAWWASLTLTAARRGLELSRPDLDELVVDEIHYFLPKDARPARPGVFLLPGFDEFLLGYQDRGAPLSSELSNAIVPGNNGIFQPTIVVDGEIVGTWRLTKSAKQKVVEPFVHLPLSATARRGLKDAAEKVVAFHEIRTAI
jgi:Winged helix DNA-binding domain